MPSGVSGPFCGWGSKEQIGITVRRGNASPLPAYNLTSVIMALGGGDCLLVTAYPTK